MGPYRWVKRALAEHGLQQHEDAFILNKMTDDMVSLCLKKGEASCLDKIFPILADRLQFVITYKEKLSRHRRAVTPELIKSEEEDDESDSSSKKRTRTQKARKASTRVKKTKKIKKEKKVHECEVCKKVLTTASSLKKHTSIHTGEKNLKCAFCDERFIYYKARKRHQDKCQQGEENLVLFHPICSITEETTGEEEELATDNLGRDQD